MAEERAAQERRKRLVLPAFLDAKSRSYKNKGKDFHTKSRSLVVQEEAERAALETRVGKRYYQLVNEGSGSALVGYRTKGQAKQHRNRLNEAAEVPVWTVRPGPDHPRRPHTSQRELS